MKKIYNPQDIERLIYNIWEKKNYFSPHGNTKKESFCVVIPPPNITGGLHMGHAFQYTIMDILVRYNRMMGKNTLWQMGLDHAGIATQLLVEQKLLLEEKKKRSYYSEKELLEKIWEWKKKSEGIIYSQIRRLGNSVDWSSSKFTLDSSISLSVSEAFVKLYNDKLIYKRKRITNWDYKLNSVVSDLEVDMRNITGNMWFIKYKIVNYKLYDINTKYLITATTRPETLLGDTAIAIHPDDKRYSHLKGAEVIVPIIKRKIPIIFDKSVDINKGTGCVKITPAHDFYDYQIGIKHKLPMISIFNNDLTIKKKLKMYTWDGKKTILLNNLIPSDLQGLGKFEARKKIIDVLKLKKILLKVIKHDFIVPHGDRSGVVIEPILTNQWYLKTKPLAKMAILAVQKKQITFIPQKYENLYFSWMNNIEDWCISRQVLWGHRIPIWYDSCGNIYTGKHEKEVRKTYSISSEVMLSQETDVLDTWFSSALWTFSSLGWPNKKKLLNIFHPSNIVVSGFDIIFFWIARMIMLTMYLIKDRNQQPQVPFKIAYITGLIRDEQGQKMSKSKGNVIDPIDMIDGISLNNLIKKRIKNLMKPKLIHEIKKRTMLLFPEGIIPNGADALRLTCASLSAPTRNINWDMNRLKSYRNFCNKLWNATRLIFSFSVNNIIPKYIDYKYLNFFDKWILLEFNNFLKLFTQSLNNYRFDQSVLCLNNFFRYNFCDWYIELIKIHYKYMYKKNFISIRYTSLKVLSDLIHVIHPIIPFITENIWEKISNLKNIKYNSIMLEPYPVYNCSLQDKKIIIYMQCFKNIVSIIRYLRLSAMLKEKELITVYIQNSTSMIKDIINKKIIYFSKMVFVKKFCIVDHKLSGMNYIHKFQDNVEFFIYITSNKNYNFKLLKIKEEIKKICSLIHISKKKLLNKNFIFKAPDNIIHKEKRKFIQLLQNKSHLIKEKKIFE
ncbi:valine--tRNA ligase [Buchnera aphidicola (Thelaxes californica)]|uniref:Valine--tRNA ligase n=1 Tax=Buchnera aphidicola (Thelaxes californica) TaxID=1315998 RepID=A0A4D6YLG5_9GAMM|nr:valine--tRNA ligase [Buchnera aphidicola]QCI26814.1 valine--tRNA ligase [Buchnera aphidicola (Thelaxes californica)]